MFVSHQAVTKNLKSTDSLSLWTAKPKETEFFFSAKIAT